MNTTAKKNRHTFSSLAYYWLRKAGRARNLALILTVAIVVSVISTYVSITGSDSPLGVDPRSVMGLILLDLVLLLALAGIITKRLVRLVLERRQGLVGSRLQTRIVVMFSLVAIVPAITMAFFSLIFFNLGIQSWFDKKVSTAIEGSVAVAQLYLEEHKKIIGADILGMANDLNRDAYNIRRNPKSFSQKLTILAGVRKVPEAIVFQRTNRRNAVLARTNLSFALQLVLEDLPHNIVEKATQGELVTLTNETDDRVMALIRLENYFDTYLLVGRFVDNNIIKHMELTTGAANEYEMLQGNVSSLQIQFFIVFMIVSLLLLLAAIWFGLVFAMDLVKPVSTLVSATEKVKEGNLSARVPEGPEDDEVATLGRAFNRMTEQLERQREEIVSAQRRAAWSDVARRIAHEIKNPLTPIQLAAERLKRKHSDEVGDKEMFTKYVDTIIKNVGDIGKMVEEFVSFARIPAPVFENNDICQLTSEIVFAREVASSDTTFEQNLPKKPLMIHCDAGQITRVLANLLKNAQEAIEENQIKDKDFGQGNISVTVEKKDGKCAITIKDNGKGFPKSMMSSLTEPYVTTKSKGTGLGLAIVKKIIEDHSGEMIFSNTKEGACIYVTLPLAT